MWRENASSRCTSNITHVDNGAMKHEANAPETPATQFLQRHRVAHSNHLYEYEEHGGTSRSLAPLPRVRTTPSARLSSNSLRLTSSDTRKPVA